MSIITNGISKESINGLFNPKSDCNQDDIYYNNETECINRNNAVKFCNIVENLFVSGSQKIMIAE